ncbi:hypothetical protein K7X08_016764 [Anisodus acutangulus]|uniref:Gnk2-homologous domain-containing protein n=1 Tax=Anisodus acutangulus TaxID=402998 RepID=A0A9Q1LU19_9SOLA|nr:hypothetical protein K7X08_016764 [Anisodus acutangulus]
MNEDYMKILFPYDDEASDHMIDALKAELEGVTVLISPNHGSRAPSSPGKEHKELYDELDTQPEDLYGNSLAKGDGGRFGVGTRRVRVEPRVSSVQVEQEGLQQRLEKMEQSLNIVVSLVEKEKSRRSENEKKTRLESLKDEHFVFVFDPITEVPRPADDVKKVEVPRPTIEVKEVDVPRQAADVGKVELPRPTADVPVSSVEVVNGTDVLDQAQPSLLFTNCGNNGDYAQNSAYQRNHNALLSSLSSNMNNYGFYNAFIGRNTNNMVSAIVLCRGDVDLKQCRTCVNNVAQKLVCSCPNKKQAFGEYDECMLQYSGRSILDTPSNLPLLYMWDDGFTSKPEEFNQKLKKLMEILRGVAAYVDPLGKYATDQAIDQNYQTIYALVQCTPDLSPQDCLTDSYGAMATCPCNGN